MTAESTTPFPRPLVLVADDEPAIRRLVTEVLEGAGFRTVATPDGTGIVELAVQYQPAVILLDIIMRNVDGYTAAVRLKGHPAVRDIPIVFVTAQDAPVYRTVGVGLGASAHLTKPFTARQLTDVVQRVMGERQVVPTAAREAAGAG